MSAAAFDMSPPPPLPPLPYDHLETHHMGGFGYGIGVCIGVLLLITTITLASYFCTRSRLQSHSPPANNSADNVHVADHQDQFVLNLQGLDESTIKSYPKILYSEAAAGKKLRSGSDLTTTATSSCCSICLAEYKGSDQLRRLPECNHMFHAKCVDPWLRMHPTCPLCRTSPLPTPLSTPLAEVTPLAAARICGFPRCVYLSVHIPQSGVHDNSVCVPVSCV